MGKLYDIVRDIHKKNKDKKCIESMYQKVITSSGVPKEKLNSKEIK